jgi:tRNA A-37 threonylcarbamoyl transferase component Bud32
MTTIFKQIQKLTPVAYGGFSELYVMSGNAVKLIEDQDYREILEESYKQNLAAEAGLAPAVHAVYRKKDQVVVVMDKIDTDTWYHADAGDDVTPTLLGELDNYDMEIGLKLYAQLLKAGVLHADFHTGNWFMNDDGEAIAIDFGLASELHEASDKHIKRAIQFMLPALQTLDYDSLASDLYEAWIAGPEVAREELLRVADALV